MSFSHASLTPPDRPACRASWISVSSGSSVSTLGPSRDTRRARANSSSMSIEKLPRTEARLIRCQCTSAEVPKRVVMCTWPRISRRITRQLRSSMSQPLSSSAVTASPKARRSITRSRSPYARISLRGYTTSDSTGPFTTMNGMPAASSVAGQGGQLADHLHVMGQVELIDGAQQRAQLRVERRHLARAQEDQVGDTVVGRRLAHQSRRGTREHGFDALRCDRPVVLDGAAPQQLEQSSAFT